MKSRVSIAALLLCALVIAASIIYRNRAFYHDDAYISLRYAKNFNDGNGIVWNPGERVQGYTNFLQLMLISALGRAGADLVSASRIVGFVAWGLVVLLVFGFAKYGTPLNRGGSLWLFPVILMMASAPMLIWALGGLEGDLFAFFIAAGCLLLLSTIDAPGSWASFGSGLCFGLGYLVRPDAIVFIAVSAGWLLVRWWTGRQRGLQILAFAIPILAIVIPYTVWEIMYYGDFVPNTFYAKSGAPLSARLISAASYLIEYCIAAPFLLIIGAVCLVYTARAKLWTSHLTYLVLQISAYLLFIVWAGGDHMKAFRLFLPLIPLLGYTIFLCLAALSSVHPQLNVTLLAVFALLVCAFQLDSIRENPLVEDPAARVGRIVGNYIATAWPSGSLVALETAGSTPYYASGNRYIDMLGLNDAQIAKRHINQIELPLQRVPGHTKGDGDYVLSRNPDYIIFGPAHGTRASTPWFLSDLEISRDPRFLRDYELQVVDLNQGDEISGDEIFIFYRRIANPRAPSAR